MAEISRPNTQEPPIVIKVIIKLFTYHTEHDILTLILLLLSNCMNSDGPTRYILKLNQVKQNVPVILFF